MSKSAFSYEDGYSLFVQLGIDKPTLCPQRDQINDFLWNGAIAQIYEPFIK